MIIQIKRALSIILSITLLSASIGSAQAAIVTNSQIIHNSEQSNDEANLLRTIQRADIQSQLSSMGVSSADIEARVQQMTHAEITQLNQQLDELPAGSGILGTVVLIFIVFVVTDVIGATDIFPFIHPVR